MEDMKWNIKVVEVAHTIDGMPVTEEEIRAEIKAHKAKLKRESSHFFEMLMLALLISIFIIINFHR